MHVIWHWSGCVCQNMEWKSLDDDERCCSNIIHFKRTDKEKTMGDDSNHWAPFMLIVSDFFITWFMKREVNTTGISIYIYSILCIY